MLCLCPFDGKISLPEWHQTNFFLKCGELRIHAMVWADLASGPQSRHNAENGSCNRGLFGPETAIYFLFNQKYAQPLHF